MRIVVDTNVFVSGIFFAGPPHRILSAWRDGHVTIVYSPAIAEEYQRVLAELSREFPQINGQPFLDLLARWGELVRPSPLATTVCRDPEDVKFIDCLLRSRAHCLVSGDRDLLEARIDGALILSPRRFWDRYL
jgi:putative PIN family toxin of toxin-antitoxin system